MQTPPVGSQPLNLTPGNLSVAKEGTYFVFVLIISILAWVALAFTIIGLVYGLLIGLFLWIGNGLLIAYLRSEAVRVSEKQLPELHATFLDVCARLGVRQIPALYVLEAGGALNAFATRFSGRDFVVIYADFLGALGAQSSEMKFVLGHELGHIKSRHILKQILLAPGLFCPLIGPAYRRAWESSCDRHGAYAANDVEGSVRAMMVLGGGRDHGRSLNAEVYAAQHTEERGFFVSLHELTSGYPTLSRHVSDVLALKYGQPAPAPKRNPFAYLFGLFVPGGNLGGGGASSLLIMVVVVGLLAAMAIPAFQKVRESATHRACYNSRLQLEAALEQHILEQGKAPDSWDEIVGAGKLIATMPVCPTGGSYSASSNENGKYVAECSTHGSGPPPRPGAPR